MDMRGAGLDHGHMPPRPRKGRRLRPEAPEPLYIGQWIRALGMRQIDVVRVTGMNEGYLSELCSGKSDKIPGWSVMSGIADALGIPVDYLRRPPPDQGFIEQAASLDPAVLARLRNRRPQ